MGILPKLKNKESQNKSFEILLSKYKEPIYWHIRKIVLDHDDAHDVLQNTFIKVFKAINGFKEQSKLYTWIYRIATNESLNFIKSKAKKHFKTSEEITNKVTRVNKYTSSKTKISFSNEI